MANFIPRGLRSQAGGFSLVELMVALVAGLIVSAAVLSFFFSSMKSNGEYVQSTRLSQELRNSMDLLTRDLRRAGYDQNGMAQLAKGTASPFAPVQISGECILYSYDKANAVAGAAFGALDVANGEVHGIRRVAVTNLKGQPVGVLEYAESLGTTKPACNGATAIYTTYPPSPNPTSRWMPLSDPSVLNVTALTFTDARTVVGTSPDQVQLRHIGISLAGQIAGSTEFTRTVTGDMRIRSDCYRTTNVNTLCSASP